MTDEGDEDTRYELHVPMADLSPWFAEAEDYVRGDIDDPEGRSLLGYWRRTWRSRRGAS